MVDAEDLKSFGHCDRVGSSPTIPTTKINDQFLGRFLFIHHHFIWHNFTFEIATRPRFPVITHNWHARAIW